MPEITGIHYRWYQGEISQKTLPIIFIHGVCSDSRIWPKTLREVGPGSVLMLDLPGHGQSQSVCKHSVNSYRQSLSKFIDTLEIKNPLLIGLGVGGSIILNYIAHYPDRVSGFVTINTAQSYFVPNQALSAIRANQYLPAAVAMMRKGMNIFSNPDVWEEIQLIAQSQRASVLAADLQLMHHHSCPFPWDTIAAVPGLFLYGTGDRLLRGIPTNLPGNLNARMIPGKGHWLPLENPELIRREILGLLKVVPPPSVNAKYL